MFTWSNLFQVKILKTSSAEILQSEAVKKNIKKEGEIVIMLKGYIHPLDAQPIYGTNSLKLFVMSSGIQFKFAMSNDSSVENLVCLFTVNYF